MACCNRHLIPLFALLAALRMAAASPNDDGDNPVVRFTVFAPSPVANLSYVRTEKPVRRLQPLVFFPSMRSPAYEYRGVMPLRFVDTDSGEVVAAVSVPREIRHPLLILFPAPPASANGGHYDVYVHDDATTEHGAGGLAVLNFSGLLLSGTIDRKRVELGSGYNGPFAVGAKASVRLVTWFHSRSLQSYAETIAPGRDGRALLILLPPFRPGSIEVQSRVLLDEVAPAKRATRQE